MATNDTGASYLAWLMARRSWSSNRLADIATDVSGSSIRYYLRGSVPSAAKAAAVAICFGPEDGARLVRLWGHEDLADGFAEDYPSMLHGHEEAIEKLLALNRIEYEGEPLTESEASEVVGFIDYLRRRQT
jgi:hypothetical protein